MDTRRLEIFLKLLETESFSHTASALGVTQPSVSASIKALEEDFGQKFFARNSRKVTALASARILAPFAEKIVSASKEAEWTLGNQAFSNREKLAIGCSSVPSLAIAPKAMVNFRNLYPQIFVTLRASGSAEVCRQVSKGIIDLGMVGSEPDSKLFWSKPLMSDRLVLVCSSNLLKEMKGCLPNSLESLASWPLILREPGSGTREAFVSEIERAARLSDFNIRAEVTGAETIMALVKASYGAAIISNLVLPIIKLGHLRSLDLNLTIKRRFHLIGLRDAQPRPAARAMASVIEALAASMPA
ncbi:MAG: LysR family transcriptional regulator [Deltaproteobacteria bacterium]|jgi:DNA-binding transcriptional LysR family regulator|nr:LysR family transcriptional regulator [Deltaproteobacteria bacterium]